MDHSIVSSHPGCPFKVGDVVKKILYLIVGGSNQGVVVGIEVYKYHWVVLIIIDGFRPGNYYEVTVPELWEKVNV